jgi:hypothetical protein
MPDSPAAGRTEGSGTARSRPACPPTSKERTPMYIGIGTLLLVVILLIILL